MGNRRCEQCNGNVPHRMSRQRNDKGQLVCEECITMNTPEWTAGLRYATQMGERTEMRRRIADALASIHRVRRTSMQVVAHDSGDNAIVHHCFSCGSGAVVGSSDGTVSCQFCHSNFTVQVQPSHPFMPQTVNGQPVSPPGMPGDQPTEMSSPLDPAVNETEEGAVGDTQAPAPGDNPFRSPKGKPSAPEKDDKDSGGSQPPWLKNKASSRRTAAKDFGVPAGYEDQPETVVDLEGWEWTRVSDPSNENVLVHSYVPTAEIGRSPLMRTLEYIENEYGLTPRQASRESARDSEPTALSYRTADGHTLDESDYMAHLALSFAAGESRDDILDTVRARRTVDAHKVSDLLNPSSGIDDNDRDQLSRDTDSNWEADLLRHEDDPAIPQWHPSPWLLDENGRPRQ